MDPLIDSLFFVGMIKKMRVHMQTKIKYLELDETWK